MLNKECQSQNSFSKADSEIENTHKQSDEVEITLEWQYE